MTTLNLEKDKKLLVATLRKLKSSKDLSSFIDDLLTEEDPPANAWSISDWRAGILDLSQRIKIAKLILEGKTYNEIAEKIQTSTSTVSKIGQIIKYGKGGLRKVLSQRKS